MWIASERRGPFTPSKHGGLLLSSKAGRQSRLRSGAGLSSSASVQGVGIQRETVGKRPPAVGSPGSGVSSLSAADAKIPLKTKTGSQITRKRRLSPAMSFQAPGSSTKTRPDSAGIGISCVRQSEAVGLFWALLKLPRELAFFWDLMRPVAIQNDAAGNPSMRLFWSTLGASAVSANSGTPGNVRHVSAPPSD